MKVLITGAKGFVGRVVAEELSKKHKVEEFDRSIGHNILDKRQLLEKMKGKDAVIHLAAIVENNHPDIWSINVSGTKTVVEAAIRAKVGKIIYLSSTGVYGFTKKAVNENTPLAPENNYEKSKAEGERIILDAHGEINAYIIRSAMVFGANDYWKKMFKLIEKEYPLPCNGKNTYQTIYVKELSRAIKIVLEKGKSGETYLVSGKEKPTLNEFCKIVQGELGVKQKVKHIPSFIGIILGKLTGAKLLTMENIRHISKERNYDTRKIEKLGYVQKTTLEKAIKEVAKEFKEEKL